MLRNVAAYAVVCLLAPTFSGLVDFVFMPIIIPLILLTSPAPEGGGVRTPARMLSHALFTGIVSVISAFAAIWFARTVFGWFGVRFGVAIAWVLGVAFTLNNLSQMRRTPGTLSFSRTIADLAGIVLGAKYLL